MKKIAKRIIRRKKDEPQNSSNPPKITTKTIADHREEIIGGARKYIYPLQHSKHKVLLISISVLVACLIGFVSYFIVALYRYNGNSAFLYRITQVLPLPVANAGGDWVAYENYLFELRHYIHYYESQQNLDFESVAGRDQLADFRKQALEKVINDAYVKKLANKYKLSVSDQEIEEQIAIVREQNRLGSNEQVFEDVLREYWGWSVADFKRTLKTQLLAQKVVATLDTNTNQQAQDAFKKLNDGTDFAKVAKEYSDDTSTKDNGGEFGSVGRANRDLTAKTIDTLFSLKKGEHSDIINIGYSLQIVKKIEDVSETRVKGAHILFNFEDISVYIADLKSEKTPRVFISP